MAIVGHVGWINSLPYTRIERHDHRDASLPAWDSRSPMFREM
jgi:hypothetical protein